MEYGVFDGVGSTLYMKLYLRKLVDEGTGSTFNALESRGFIMCKYTWKRMDGDREALERFLMLQITKERRKLVPSATGAKAYRPGAPGTLREWHWKAMVEAWKSRLAGVNSEYGEDYGYVGWNTWLRLSALREQFYREHWQRYCELYPEVDAPAPDLEKS
jgi:hypothetical protein